MYHRLEISRPCSVGDGRSAKLAALLAQLFNIRVSNIRCRDVYSLFTNADKSEVRAFAAAITDPITQRYQIGDSDDADFDWLIAIGLLPGVTDNVAATACQALADVIGRPLGDGERIYASVEYLLTDPQLTRRQVEQVADRALANPVINSITVLSRLEWRLNGCPVNRPEIVSDDEAVVTTYDLSGDDEQLLAISRDGMLALTLPEMLAIRDYFAAPERRAEREQRGLSEQPTDVELEVLAQTWSEHCKHKIFDAIIDYTDEQGRQQTIDSCYRTFIKTGTAEIGKRVDWLVSVFKDNAGVISFTEKWDLVYKVETHNSPSALDPYGGAMTGIVGVNRDPMGTGLGANLLINVWGYCLASPFTPPSGVPDGLMHPRRIRDGVHQGCIEGGNQSGIPYGLGWEYFDPRYTGKPLVFCGTVGLLPKEIAGAPGHQKTILPGDFIVMAGGRIGKDGIHGATFSSEELHGTSPVQAVQIGDPITQKKLADFLYEARDAGLYRFVTDNGAGGLSCSVGEMATECGGAELELSKAPLKYDGLQPWEILLSEAQERMTFAVPPEHLDALLQLADDRDVELSVLGNFTDTGRYHITWHGETVGLLELDFLHHGYPRLHLQATWEAPLIAEPDRRSLADLDVVEVLLNLLGRLNICSDEYKARQYDHEVKALSVIKPFVGVGNDIPSDAVVFMAEPLCPQGIILACGIAPRYSDIDTYAMTASVIDIAVRRSIAVGGRLGELAGLDNFCWPDPVASEKTPDGEYKLAQLVRANQALYDYTTAYGVPCISGKDSMKNDSTRGGRKISVPPTLLFSTIGRMWDVSKAVTLDAKRSGDLVYVLGMTKFELGGSELYDSLGELGNDVPQVDAEAAIALYQAVAAATDAELCHSLHSPVFGGLGVAFAKIAMAGHLGLDIDLGQIPIAEPMPPAAVLFSESNSRFVATVPPDCQAAFEQVMAGVVWAKVGKVKYDPVVTFYCDDALEGEIGIDDLAEAFSSTLAEV